jgi:hypothetical protein
MFYDSPHVPGTDISFHLHDSRRLQLSKICSKNNECDSDTETVITLKFYAEIKTFVCEV